MFELLKAGGFLIWPIMICSVIALAIVVERFLVLKPKQVVPRELMKEIKEMIVYNTLDQQDISRINAHSPLGRVLAAGLRNPNQHRVVIKEAIEETGRLVVHDLEKHLQTLGTIAAITPLLGLLGTVIGMIKVFAAITTFGVGDPQALAEGISEALVTTAAGLSVGIPSLMFYRFFRGRINELTVEMEQQALMLMKLLQRQV